MTTTATNYVRDVLLKMDGPTRRALMRSMRDRVNDDPDEDAPTTALWFAVYCQIVDLDYEGTELLRHLESGR